jgi:uncharacterized Ntn-hydrolase superfamily protein
MYHPRDVIKRVEEVAFVVDREPYPMVDLRVDLHPEPVAELRRLADAYFPLVAYYNLRPRDPNVPSAVEWLAAQRRWGGDWARSR